MDSHDKGRPGDHDNQGHGGGDNDDQLVEVTVDRVKKRVKPGSYIFCRWPWSHFTLWNWYARHAAGRGRLKPESLSARPRGCIRFTS